MRAGGRVTVRLEKTLGELSFDVALNGIEKREREVEKEMMKLEIIEIEIWTRYVDFKLPVCR